MSVNSRGPGFIPSQEYFSCRYFTLREPLNFSRGTEILKDDDQALHAWCTIDDEIVSVGRSHLISAETNGSQADHVGPNAATCPDFTPLVSGECRPAIQIRQMGTMPQHRSKGYATEVLGKLEKKSMEIFAARYGFLQARIQAVPFYQSQGWEIIDELFEIPGIGPHYSMMKKLSRSG
jgi:GNAT superfamily N-acetyltransferase